MFFAGFCHFFLEGLPGTNRQTERQTNRVDGQADKQTDEQTG